MASPLRGGLAGCAGRIEFVILRTGLSPPVAPHDISRRRSYIWLQAGERFPGEDLHLSDLVDSQAHPPPTLRRWSDDSAQEPGILFIHAPADFMSVERWFSFRLRTRGSDNVGESVDGRRIIRGNKRTIPIIAPPA